MMKNNLIYLKKKIYGPLLVTKFKNFEDLFYSIALQKD